MPLQLTTLPLPPITETDLRTETIRTLIQGLRELGALRMYLETRVDVLQGRNRTEREHGELIDLNGALIVIDDRMIEIRETIEKRMV